MRCYSNLKDQKAERYELTTHFSGVGAGASKLFQKATQPAQSDGMVRDPCFGCGRRGSEFGIRDLKGLVDEATGRDMSFSLFDNKTLERKSHGA